MEQETLFTAAKWDILKALSTSKKAPIELAEETNTSISNISQSLRFLELAGLVKSERISNRDKGQPRVVYSLAKDTAYIIVTSFGFTQKDQVDLDDRKKAFIKIWMFQNKKFHRFLEKAITELEKAMDKLDGVVLDQSSLVDVNLLLIPKEGQSVSIKDFSFDFKDVTKKIKFSTSSWDKINKDVESYYSIHDPQSNFRGINQ